MTIFKVYIRIISIFLITALSLSLSSCRQVEHISEDFKIPDEVIEEDPIPVDSNKDGLDEDKTHDKVSVERLGDLYESLRDLRIQRNGETEAYDASIPLASLVYDMFSKVNEPDMTSPDGEKLSRSFDYSQYDYRLKFDGAEDILFTMNGNVFHFEGEKQLYYLWGDSEPFWDSVIFDKKNNSADIHQEKLRVMEKSYKVDLNNDGADENIALVYEREKNDEIKGDLSLIINGIPNSIIKNEAWSTTPYHTIGVMPELRFIKDYDGKCKAAMVIYSWATNGIGSTGVINAFKYQDGNISEVNIQEPERNIKYSGENLVDISFPAFQRTVSVEIDSDSYKQFLGGDSLKQQLEAKDTFGSHPLWYIFRDFNGDGEEELCSVSLLRHPPLDLCRINTYYRYEDGILKPVQAFVASYCSEEKKLLLREGIIEHIHMNGYFTIGPNGIPDTFNPGFDYTPEELEEVLRELKKERILKLTGDKLYINF